MTEERKMGVVNHLMDVTIPEIRDLIEQLQALQTQIMEQTIPQVEGQIRTIERRKFVPFSTKTDTNGLVTIDCTAAGFNDVGSIVPLMAAGTYNGRPCTYSVISIGLKSVTLKLFRTRAPVAMALGLIFEQFEAAPTTQVYGFISGSVPT